MDRSTTAVRAYIATRLEGRTDEGFLNDDLGVALNTTAVRRAAGPWRWRPPGYQRPGRRAESIQQPGAGTAIRDWLTVQAGDLDLGLGLLTFDVTGAQAQRELYRAVAAVAGVVQVLAAGDGHDRRVFAVVITDGERDRRRLRSTVDELGHDWRWDEVDHETVEPAIRTWRHLARAAARREGLLSPRRTGAPS